jgi:hypothetical protein
MLPLPRASRRRGTYFLGGVLVIAVYLTVTLFHGNVSSKRLSFATNLSSHDLQHYYKGLLDHTSNQHVLKAEEKPKRSAPGFEKALSSCRIYDLPDDPLVQEYGQNNIRLSRTYEGTGQRVRKVLQKALNGQAIKVAVVGGSVSSVSIHELYCIILLISLCSLGTWSNASLYWRQPHVLSCLRVDTSNISGART